MSRIPSLSDIFEVMSRASIGELSARVNVPEDVDTEEEAARIGLALNVLLDDLAMRVADREKMEKRLRMLAEAARAFAMATGQPEKLLGAIVRQIASLMQSSCTLNLVSDDGARIAATYTHADDPALAAHYRNLQEVWPRPLTEHPLIAEVIRTGVPIVMTDVDLGKLRSGSPPESAALALATDMRSLLAVPLRVAGRVLGTVAAGRHGKTAEHFNEHDLSFLQSVADHAALALVNARAQEELRVSEIRYRMMFDNSPLPKWLYDTDTLRFLEVNDAAVKAYGWTREEFLKMGLADIRPDEDVAAMQADARLRSPAPKVGFWRHRKKNGTIMLVEVTSHSFTIGTQACRLAVIRDVTERNQLEEQLRQSQKMEAVGRLAGGVAHDFNNLLSVILSCGEMMRAELPEGSPFRSDAEEILKAGTRARDLTRQLLTFSRHQVLDTKVIDLNDQLLATEKLLRRMVSEDIELRLVLTKDVGRVRVDPGSIDQVVMNLVVNARDAMPTGGTITIETANVTLDAEYARSHLGANAGRHVMVAVTDTGVGMDRTTQSRIFEPFFTTKPLGKGTGLGLSTVFGIVRQCGGSIWVYSEPGRGATFKVYIPRVDQEKDETMVERAPTTLEGNETILLVEDDPQVRGVAYAILKRHGYDVLEAPLAEEALRICREEKRAIHLLLTDVVMPQMSGPELARRLVIERPEMRVLCMSGYTDDSIVRHGVVDESIAYLQKPLTPETLTRKVREILDDRP